MSSTWAKLGWPSASRVESALYGSALRARSTAYDRGWLPATRVGGLRVISVGGLKVGGEGKTPLTMWLAATLHGRGVPVAVLCRGYQAAFERSGGVVSDGAGLVAQVDQGGDEAVLIARRLPQVMVMAGADRVDAARRARALGASTIVLDSGFQHRRLARDLDLLVRTCDGDGAQLLPAGPYRESPDAARRAHLLAFLHSGQQVSPLPADKPAFAFMLEPRELVDAELRPSGSLADVRGQKAVLVTGIARPRRLEATARLLGVTIVDWLRYRDHYPFRRADRSTIVRRAIQTRADLVLTTEKDLVRLVPSGCDLGAPVLAIRVEPVITKGEAHLASALNEISSGLSLG